MGTPRKVAEKPPKAAAKSTSNQSPVSHGGPNPPCDLGFFGSPQTRLSAAGGSHAPSRARGCRSRSGAHFFVHNNMDNPLLGRATMRPRQKGNTRGSGATNPRKLASDLAQPEFGAATFSECGRGRMGGVICSRAGVLSEGRTQDLTRYFQSLDTDSCELIAIDHPRRAIFAQHRNSDDAFARIFWSPVLHHSRPRMCLQPEKRKSFVDA